MRQLEVTLNIYGETGISVSLPLHPEGIDELGEEAKFESSSGEKGPPGDGRLLRGDVSNDEETDNVTNAKMAEASSDVDLGGENVGQKACDTFAGSEEDD